MYSLSALAQLAFLTPVLERDRLMIAADILNRIAARALNLHIFNNPAE